MIGLVMDIWLPLTAWQPDGLSADTLLAWLLVLVPQVRSFCIAVAIPVDQVLLFCSAAAASNHSLFLTRRKARFSKLVLGN
ncbi:unnamed protein product [Tuber melanosporum]|uniref:(Perigord truffle) hypothetical protein n=1 Tax=Tuber melanosporum (strain Mel28) TaxID=656061 RepID=D5G630_TUBMM|nr:uncharacterized protein GSTUM_00001746001 [Tuber melanosporum]CAZ79973.1 unnamed protein product [Tuber melanosporum]